MKRNLSHFEFIGLRFVGWYAIHLLMVIVWSLIAFGLAFFNFEFSDNPIEIINKMLWIISLIVLFIFDKTFKKALLSKDHKYKILFIIGTAFFIIIFRLMG